MKVKSTKFKEKKTKRQEYEPEDGLEQETHISETV